ncbi:hypothetical protein NE237_028311 [Protea cynaroides]|uniref:Uncharacterized protein n=1 Tax=Protea cynaroides TaxID=273540 RepID=A0A9Q0GQ53_9MAGN|nr:hypothetical protein NE237_028311 [Protea cynaroides]
MNWSSKLHHQKPCSCIPMDIGNWCSSGRSIQLGRRFIESDYDDFMSATRSSVPRWRVLWMRIKKEKKKILNLSSAPVQVPYNSYTYSQNFDQGSAWTEPDNLSRSFSARFAVPCRIFEKMG